MRSLPPLIGIAAAAGLATLAAVVMRDEAASCTGAAGAERVDASAMERPVAAAEVDAQRIELVRERREADDYDSTRARHARPGSERWHRERLDELARCDPLAFASEARQRLVADAELPEKVALLQVARRRDAALADELWSCACDVDRTGDARLQEAARILLALEAARSAGKIAAAEIETERR